MLISSALIIAALDGDHARACNKGPTNTNSARLELRRRRSKRVSLALPLTNGRAAASSAAPAAAALPPAPRAADLSLGSRRPLTPMSMQPTHERRHRQAPPTTAFDYQGVRPWVWRTAAQAERMVEPIDGGYRYVITSAWRRRALLVRDPQYSTATPMATCGGVRPQRSHPAPPTRSSK